MQPLVPPQTAWPTVTAGEVPTMAFVSQPTLALSPLAAGASVQTSGRKIRLRLESAATECEFVEDGIVSIRKLLPALTTPSTEPLVTVGATLKFILLAPR